MQPEISGPLAEDHSAFSLGLFAHRGHDRPLGGRLLPSGHPRASSDRRHHPTGDNRTNRRDRARHDDFCGPCLGGRNESVSPLPNQPHELLLPADGFHQRKRDDERLSSGGALPRQPRRPAPGGRDKIRHRRSHPDHLAGPGGSLVEPMAVKILGCRGDMDGPRPELT